MLAGPVLFYANLCTPFKCEQNTTTAAAHLLGEDALVWPDAAALARDLRHVGLSCATEPDVAASPAWHVVTAHFAVPRGLVHSVCVLGTPGAKFVEHEENPMMAAESDDQTEETNQAEETNPAEANDAAAGTSAKKLMMSPAGMLVGCLACW